MTNTLRTPYTPVYECDECGVDHLEGDSTLITHLDGYTQALCVPCAADLCPSCDVVPDECGECDCP